MNLITLTVHNIKKESNNMALLNLKTFLKRCETRLVYYDHLDYHLFTNGVIMYGIAKGTRTERPDMYLKELLEKVTIKSSERNSSVFEAVVNAYNQSPREFVVDYEKHVEVTKAKNKLMKEHSYDTITEVAIATNLLKCCKVKPAGGKQAFLCQVNFRVKPLLCYFETSLLDDEFIFIMPISLK